MSDKTESQKAAKGKKGTRGEEKEVRTYIHTYLCHEEPRTVDSQSIFFIFLFLILLLDIYNNVVATIIIFTPLVV